MFTIHAHIFRLSQTAGYISLPFTNLTTELKYFAFFGITEVYGCSLFRTDFSQISQCIASFSNTEIHSLTTLFWKRDVHFMGRNENKSKFFFSIMDLCNQVLQNQTAILPDMQVIITHSLADLFDVLLLKPYFSKFYSCEEITRFS